MTTKICNKRCICVRKPRRLIQPNQWPNGCKEFKRLHLGSFNMGHEDGSFKELICFGNDYVQSLLNVYYGSRWFHIDHFIMSNRSSFKSLNISNRVSASSNLWWLIFQDLFQSKNYDDSKMKSKILGDTPLKTNMSIKNPHCSIGNTSSNGGFSIVMLVFWVVSFLGLRLTGWIHVWYIYPTFILSL